MDYTAYFDFNDGVGERGPYSLRTATPDEDYCSESFKRVVSQYSCSMLPDSGFLAAHAVTSGDTFVRILADGSLVFKGLIPPTDSWTSNGVALNGAPDLSDFTFEVLDYSAWLNREVKADDDIAWENQYICNPSLPGSSLAHRLLTLCGISGSLFQPTFSIPAVLRGFALDEGTVIGDALDSLLWQYGYVLRWSVDHFDVSPWLMETPTSSINLNEDVMLTGLKTERVERETDGIEVKWYALKEKNQCLLYMADLPFGNDNQRSGYPIEAGLLWPVEANADETWWDYEDTALASSINSAGSKTKNTDFTQLVITKNHYLEVKTDTGIVAEFSPVFRNKKAKIAYRNPTTAPLDIYYCKVFADVVYRGGENSVCKNTISSPQKTSTITAEFIHDLGYATRLACALAYQYGTACWRSTFNSELRIELGLIGALSDPYSGFSGKVLVIKRTFDPDTGSIATRLFHSRRSQSIPRQAIRQSYLSRKTLQKRRVRWGPRAPSVRPAPLELTERRPTSMSPMRAPPMARQASIRSRARISAPTSIRRPPIRPTTKSTLGSSSKVLRGRRATRGSRASTARTVPRPICT